jgi:hypothetical protein
MHDVSRAGVSMTLATPSRLIPTCSTPVKLVLIIEKCLHSRFAKDVVQSMQPLLAKLGLLCLRQPDDLGEMCGKHIFKPRPGYQSFPLGFPIEIQKAIEYSNKG